MNYKVCKNPSTVLGFINGKDVRMLTVEQGVISFESPDLIEGAFDLMISISNLDTYEFEEFTFNNCKVISKTDKHFTHIYNVKLGIIETKLFEDFNKLLKGIQNAEQIFDETVKGSNGLLKSLVKDFSHYPYEKDNEYFDNFEEQLEYLYDLPDNKLRISPNVEVAFTISNYTYYDQVIKSSYKEVIENTLKRLKLQNHGIFLNPITRVYIGSEFCPSLFPDSKLLLSLVEKAHEEGLDITVSYPYLIERNVNFIRNTLQQLNDYCTKTNIHIEITINDWGIISLILSEKFSSLLPILGRLLNKRKKDTRMIWKLGFKKLKSSFEENNLNCEHFIKYLQSLGIYRFEFEAYNLKNKIPEGNHTIHFPFFQTNTTSHCLVYASCKNYPNRRQELPINCPHYCSEFYFLYPKHLNIVGKGNSIFGFDNSIFLEQNDLDDYINAGIDRLAFTPD